MRRWRRNSKALALPSGGSRCRQAPAFAGIGGFRNPWPWQPVKSEGRGHERSGKYQGTGTGGNGRSPGGPGRCFAAAASHPGRLYGRHRGRHRRARTAAGRLWGGSRGIWCLPVGPGPKKTTPLFFPCFFSSPWATSVYSTGPLRTCRLIISSISRTEGALSSPE